MLLAKQSQLLSIIVIQFSPSLFLFFSGFNYASNPSTFTYIYILNQCCISFKIIHFKTSGLIMLSLLLPSLLQLFPSFAATRSLFCLIFQFCLLPLCKKMFSHNGTTIFVIIFLIVDYLSYKEGTMLTKDESKTNSEKTLQAVLPAPLENSCTWLWLLSCMTHTTIGRIEGAEGSNDGHKRWRQFSLHLTLPSNPHSDL